MISFPISLADFWQQQKLASYGFVIGENMETSETGGGEILSASTGPRLWGGTIVLGISENYEVDDAMALIDLLRQPGGSFLINDARRSAPRFDPAGTVQGAAVATVLSVTNGREMVIDGLPDGFQLTRGDHLSISYGTDPVRYYLARVVTGGVVSTTLAVEVQPFIPSGIEAGDVVTFQNPVCKAVYVPGSFSGGARLSARTEAVTFSWQQTLR